MPPQTEDKPAGANAMVVLIALAFAGGFADAAAYLLTGSFTGHITGNTVLGAIALAGGKIDAFQLHLTAVVAFLLATAGGILLTRLRLKNNATLTLALLMEAALIGVATSSGGAHPPHSNVFMLVCLCLALGLQNGIFSKSEGVSVHATYVTGDTSSLLVSLLRRPSPGSVAKSPNKRTTDTVLGVVWPSFAVGAALAGLAVHYMAAHALWLLEIPLLVATIFAWNRASDPPTNH